MSNCNGGVKLFKKGERLFLTTKERHLFRQTIGTLDTPQRHFCRLLYYSGCKLSEATTLFPHQICESKQSILLGSSGRNLAERMVPVPPALVMELSIHFPPHTRSANKPLWSMSRSKGWRIVTRAMSQAGIHGKYANPKGLRHSFAISCLELWPKISLKQVQRWLGHRSIDLTLSYYKAFDHNVEIEHMEELWNCF